MFPSPTSSARAAQAIWPRSTQTPPRQSRSLAGRQRKRLPICAATAGAGRPGTRPDIKPGAFKKHIEPCTGTPVFRFRQKTVAFLKKRCYDISASNRQGSYIGSTAASQAAEAGSTPVPCSIKLHQKDISAKNPEVSTVSPHRYTMCHGGTVGTGKRNVTHEFELRSVFAD